MKETFDRRDRLAGDNIPSLEKRITNNEGKIQTIRGKPDAAAKVDQIAKLEEQIAKVLPLATFRRREVDDRIVTQFDNC